MAPKKILIVDDEPALRIAIRDYLVASGYEVEEAGSCKDAAALVHSTLLDAAIVDYSLPDGTALDLLSKMKATDRMVPTIVLTGHGSIELAVQTMQEGAEQFLTKPVQLSALKVLLERTLDNHRNRQKQQATSSRTAREALNPFLGESSRMRNLAEQAQKIAPSDSPILIQGETGAGKGVLAKWFHAHSTRAEEAFVDLNCAGLTRDLLETELFGHEKGAFTGAVASKVGLLEIAHRGTVFLDEIGDMDPVIQPKLLKVLEDKQFRRLGETRDRRVDIRLIAATHQSLSELTAAKKFRSDLYFRISTIPINIPPLRERPEDIPVIATTLLQQLSVDMGRHGIRISADAMLALTQYSWPGNIREVRNVLERAILLAEENILQHHDLLFEPDPPKSLDSVLVEGMTLSEMEKKYIEKVLRDRDWSVVRAAEVLGVPRSSLYQKIKLYQIPLPRNISNPG